MNPARFQVQWNTLTYHAKKPHICGPDFFTEANGFDAADVAAVLAMEPGDEIAFDNWSVIVTRIDGGAE